MPLISLKAIFGAVRQECAGGTAGSGPMPVHVSLLHQQEQRQVATLILTKHAKPMIVEAMNILAEGAIALSVTLSLGALFAS